MSVLPVQGFVFVKNYSIQFWGTSSPLCWFNNKGIFVHYTSNLTQLYYLIY